MEVPIAMLADAANMAGSKVNLLGVFDTIWGRTFPATHPMMYLVLRFEISPAEFGSRKELEVKFLSPDGASLAALRGHFTLPERAEFSGRRAHTWEILPLANTELPAPGDYQIAVMINGETKREIPLYAELLVEEDET